MSQRHAPLCALAVTAVTLLSPAAAGADTSSTGGAEVAAPEVENARCADGRTWRCDAGKPLTIVGEQLARAEQVIFMGGPGRGDERRARPGAADQHSVRVRVPRTAVSGRLRVVSPSGSSESPRRLRIRAAHTESGGDEEETSGRKLFAGGRRAATFRYTVSGPVPRGAAIEIVRLEDDAVVARKPIPTDAASGVVRWYGMDNGRTVRVGRYAFRLSSAAESAVEPDAGQPNQFAVYDHIFPIRGPHDLGQTATNNFGGGRNHQGQDMFAACGTPLAAVTPAKVMYAGYHSAAGNYAVLQRADGRSYAYMHMRDPALVKTGDRVYTGERLGYVGETGRATGCHLHFELWTAPGWYEGGKAIDPLPLLRKWDSWS